MEAWREQPGERMRMHLRRPGGGTDRGKIDVVPGLSFVLGATECSAPVLRGVCKALGLPR